MPDISKSALVPDWISDPSVMDPWYKRAGGTIARMLGADDPSSGLPSPGAMGVALIPPAIARERGPSLIADAVKQGLPQRYIQALEFAQQRWPRLFGHIAYVDASAPKYAGASTKEVKPAIATMMRDMYPGMEKRTGTFSHIGINPNAGNNPFDTIGHELTHVADSITDPEAMDKYLYKQNLPGGYPVNSDEIRAKMQGAKTAAYQRGFTRQNLIDATFKDDGRTAKILPKVDSRISGLPPEGGVREISTPTNEDKIYEIMKDRMGGTKIPISERPSMDPSYMPSASGVVGTPTYNTGAAAQKLMDKYGTDWVSKLTELHQKGMVPALLQGLLDEPLGLGKQ